MHKTFVSPRALIRRAADQFTDRPAVRMANRNWTFGEIDERARRLANALQTMGVERGDAVAVLSGNSPAHPEIAMALLKLGAVLVQVNPRITQEELGWQLDYCGARVLIAGEGYGEAAVVVLGSASPIQHVLTLDANAEGALDPYEQVLRAAGTDEPETPLESTDRAYIRFTSGTTGTPKAVVHAQATVIAVTRNLLIDYLEGIKPNDVLAPVQGLYHGAGWFMLPCWLRGASLSISADFAPEQVVRQCSRDQVTVIKTVPTLLRRLLQSESFTREALPELGTVIYGGSPIDPATLSAGIEEFGPVFVQLYGQAEAPMTITVLKKQEHGGRRLASVGRPVTLIDVDVVNESGVRVPSGEAGELLVRGDHTMSGYLRPDGSLEEPASEWVSTGDVARLDDDGFVYLVDRKNQMIVTGGLNVYPNEVEQVLYSHPAVAEVAVVGAPDSEWGERVVAVVILKEEQSTTEQDLLAFCESRLSRFKRPREILFRSELPMNAAGKIVRRVVRDQLWAGRERKVN